MPVDVIDNWDEAARALEEGAQAGMEQAAEDELEVIEDGFTQGRDALGRPWAQLAPETIRAKGHDRILIDSGDLSQSGFVQRSPTGSVYLGFSSGLAPIHEYGTRTIPRRPILAPALTDLEGGALVRAIRDEVASALRKRGFRVG